MLPRPRSSTRSIRGRHDLPPVVRTPVPHLFRPAILRRLLRYELPARSPPLRAVSGPSPEFCATTRLREKLPRPRVSRGDVALAVAFQFSEQVRRVEQAADETAHGP